MRSLFLGPLALCGCLGTAVEPSAGVAVVGVTCDPVVSRYPVRGRHNHGYDRTAGDSSMWSCGDAHSNEDFIAGDHLGNDIWAAEGTPVIATTSGRLTLVGWSDYSGNKVTIIDDCGWYHFYCHLQRIEPGIASGGRVTAGQVIGYVGRTGSASNGVVHLHYSIYPDGAYSRGIDPWPYLHAVEHDVCTDPAASCDRTAAPFTFSCDGPNAGAHCVSVDEPGDPDTWVDNYLCSATDLGFVWSASGPVDGMRCVNVYEAAEDPPDVWADDYACLPSDSPYALAWSSAGPIAGASCVHWNEPADAGGTWNDNYLCATPVFDFSAAGFTFSANGPKEGEHCVAIEEPGDPDAWHDNFFCSDARVGDLGMEWSYAGPIAGMRCTNVHEAAEPDAVWADDFLCLPPGARWEFEWSSAGPIPGETCVRWYEPSDAAESWHDNYLCVRELPEPDPPDGGVVRRDDGGTSPRDDGALIGGCSLAASRAAPPPWLLALAMLLRRARR
jgi:hypothetical protein